MSGRRISVLRPAIELALSIARQGELDDPPLPAPARLRPYLGFTRMPPAALEAARRVLEDDATFRERVAAVATEASVGPVGWAWLTRAGGWQERLEDAVGGAAATSDERQQRVLDRATERRVALAGEAASRAEAERDVLLAELERLRAEASTARRARRDLQDELERAHVEIVKLTEERSHAVRQLKTTEAALVTRAGEVRELRVRVRELDAELGRARLTADQAAEAQSAPIAPAAAHLASVRPVSAHRAPAGDDLNRRALGQAVANASAAAAQLARALGEASNLLAPSPKAGPPVAPPAPPRPPRPRRRALRMPAGVFDDTPAAAVYLARVPDVVFLVDGYNVSKSAWSELDLPSQRTRLVDALVSFQARTGARAEVVFDGVDDGGLVGRSTPGRVRVRFTPSTVEADDLLLELVEELPATTPVVVVSSDRRVRDGARSRGANTLSADLLLAVLR